MTGSADLSRLRQAEIKALRNKVNIAREINGEELASWI